MVLAFRVEAFSHSLVSLQASLCSFRARSWLKVSYEGSRISEAHPTIDQQLLKFVQSVQQARKAAA